MTTPVPSPSRKQFAFPDHLLPPSPAHGILAEAVCVFKVTLRAPSPQPAAPSTTLVTLQPWLSAIPVALGAPCQKPEPPSPLPTREVMVGPAALSPGFKGKARPWIARRTEMKNKHPALAGPGSTVTRQPAPGLQIPPFYLLD